MNSTMIQVHQALAKEHARINEEHLRLLDIRAVRPSWIIDQQLLQTAENLTRVKAAMRDLTR